MRNEKGREAEAKTAEEVKNPVGRPSIYSQEIADRICSGIIEGYSLRTVCKPDEMPCVATVLNWLRTKQEFLLQYEKAKEEQADALAEEMLDIADDGTNDWMEKFGKDGENLGYQINGEHVQRSRLRLDTRKWIASKLKPKKYGDRILTENQPLDRNGEKADNKITHVHELSPDHREMLKRFYQSNPDLLEQSTDESK